MVSFHDVMLWRGSKFRDAAVMLRAAAKRFGETHSAMAGIGSSELEGKFSEAEQRKRRSMVDDAEDLERTFQHAAQKFDLAGESADKLAKEAADLNAEVRAKGGEVDDDGTVSGVDMGFRLGNPGPVTKEDLQDTLQEGFTKRGCLCVGKAEQFLKVVEQIYSHFGIEAWSNAIESGSNVVQLGTKGPPRSTLGAQYVNDWWTALSPEEQKEIILKHPEWIGHRDGIPADARSRANTVLLHKYLDRMEELKGKVETEGESDALFKKYGVTPGEYRAYVYNNRDHVLALAKRFPMPKGGPEALFSVQSARQSLLVFDPGKGHEHVRAAIGVGDVDKAKNVMVYVPGMTTNVRDGLIGSGGAGGSSVVGLERALQVSDRQHTGGSAGVVWLDYDAPSWGESAPYQKNAVYYPHAANEAKERLSSFMEGVQQTHAGDPNLTLSGHSYGSLTAAVAAGLTDVQDQVAVWGSAGVNATTNDELNVLPGNTYVGAAEGDAVAASGRFGLNPDVNKNFEHFSTEKWTSPEGERYEASHGHSEYLSGPESKNSEGKTSTYNIGRIMSGKGMAAEEK